MGITTSKNNEQNNNYTNVYFDKEKLYFPGDCVTGYVRVKLPPSLSNKQYQVTSIRAYVRGAELHSFPHSQCCCSASTHTVDLLNKHLVEDYNFVKAPIRQVNAAVSTCIKTNFQSMIYPILDSPSPSSSHNSTAADKAVILNADTMFSVVPFHFHIPKDIPPSFEINWSEAIASQVKYTISFLVLYKLQTQQQPEAQQLRLEEDSNHDTVTSSPSGQAVPALKDEDEIFRIIDASPVRELKPTSPSQRPTELLFTSNSGGNFVIWSETPFKIGTKFDREYIVENYLDLPKDISVNNDNLFYPLNEKCLRHGFIKSREFECPHNKKSNVPMMSVRVSIQPSRIILGEDTLVKLRIKKCNAELFSMKSLKSIRISLVEQRTHTHIFEKTEVTELLEEPAQVFQYDYETLGRKQKQEFMSTSSAPSFLFHQSSNDNDDTLGLHTFNIDSESDEYETSILINIPHSSKFTGTSAVHCYYTTFDHFLQFSLEYKDSNSSSSSSKKGLLKKLLLQKEKASEEDCTWRIMYPIAVYQDQFKTNRCAKTRYYQFPSELSDITIQCAN